MEYNYVTFHLIRKEISDRDKNAYYHTLSRWNYFTFYSYITFRKMAYIFICLKIWRKLILYLNKFYEKVCTFYDILLMLMIILIHIILWYQMWYLINCMPSIILCLYYEIFFMSITCVRIILVSWSYWS